MTTIQQLKKGSDVDFVIGCVDTRKARRAIDKWVSTARVLYWLDLGNNASSGQFVLGQPKNSANRKKKDRLPTVAELYPEILKRDETEDDQPSCSAAEALTRQEPFINQSLTYQALGTTREAVRELLAGYAKQGRAEVEVGEIFDTLRSYRVLAADRKPIWDTKNPWRTFCAAVGETNSGLFHLSRSNPTKIVRWDKLSLVIPEAERKTS